MKINQAELLWQVKRMQDNHQQNLVVYKKKQWVLMSKIQIRQACNAIAFGNLNGYLRLIEQKDGDLDLRYIDIELVYQNRFKETPFHSLCRNQRNLMVEYFLNNGLGNPNIYCSAAGLTPLHLAVAVSIINDNTETLDILLRNGGDLLKRTKKGQCIEDIVKQIDPQLQKTTSIFLITLYRQVLSAQNRIIMMQILQSPARYQPPFDELTDHLLLEFIRLL